MKRRCRNCRKEARFLFGLTPACSVECAAIIGRKTADKSKAAKQKADRERVKTRRELMTEAQRAFNAYVRARDAGKPCISCGRPDDGLHQRHAGHFLSVGSHLELRFEESNCHAQCSQCNNHLSGNLLGYRPALIERIGADKVAWLEGEHQPAKFERGDLVAMKVHYRKLTRELQRANQ